MIIELIDNLKKAYPHSKIDLGGAHPSALPKLCLEKSKADFVIIGEGELSFVDLIDCLEKKASVGDIDGIAFWHGSEIVVNPKINYIGDLDNLPFPARDLLHLEKYYSTHEAMGLRKTHGHPYSLQGAVLLDVHFVHLNYGIESIGPGVLAMLLQRLSIVLQNTALPNFILKMKI